MFQEYGQLSGDTFRASMFFAGSAVALLGVYILVRDTEVSSEKRERASSTMSATAEHTGTSALGKPLLDPSDFAEAPEIRTHRSVSVNA